MFCDENVERRIYSATTSRRAAAGPENTAALRTRHENGWFSHPRALASLGPPVQSSSSTFV